MKRLLIILAAAAMMTCTGCADSGRVNDKYYLRAVSVSGYDDISLSMAFFSEGGTIGGVSGGDIASARREAELICGRQIFTGYTELLILGSCDRRNVLDFMLNNWKVSPACLVVYCPEGGELLNDKSAEELTGSVREAVKQELSPECDIITVLGGLLRGGAEIPEVGEEGFVRTVKIS